VKGVSELYRLMRSYPGLWAVAGGWAIDLFLGRVTREHSDIEIAISRQDQARIREHLKGWDFQKVVRGAVQPWRAGEWLNLPIHEVYAVKTENKLEILLNEIEGDDWIYRRDTRICRPVSQAVCQTSSRIPYLSPEVVLLYKSKNPRAKDEIDLANAAAEMNIEQKEWLSNSLRIVDGQHPWIRKLNT